MVKLSTVLLPAMAFHASAMPMMELRSDNFPVIRSTNTSVATNDSIAATTDYRQSTGIALGINYRALARNNGKYVKAGIGAVTLFGTAVVIYSSLSKDISTDQQNKACLTASNYEFEYKGVTHYVHYVNTAISSHIGHNTCGSTAKEDADKAGLKACMDDMANWVTPAGLRPNTGCCTLSNGHGTWRGLVRWSLDKDQDWDDIPCGEEFKDFEG